jgi:hypothetical protein
VKIIRITLGVSNKYVPFDVFFSKSDSPTEYVNFNSINSITHGKNKTGILDLFISPHTSLHVQFSNYQQEFQNASLPFHFFSFPQLPLYSTLNCMDTTISGNVLPDFPCD